MLASDLLGAQVRDCLGENVGRVHDLVFESDGGRVRLRGLLCGPAAHGRRMGYGSLDMAGPWVLNKAFALMLVDAIHVPWHAVASREDDVITLNIAQDQLR